MNPKGSRVSEYRYRLTSTGYSSHRYGPCEVCGEHASEVFLQLEARRYHFDADDLASIDDEALRAEIKVEGWMWTRHNCYSYFGHKLCLIGKRR